VPVMAIRATLAIICLLLMHVAMVRSAYAEAVAVGLAYACANLAIACATVGRKSLHGPWLVPVALMLGAEIAILYGYVSAIVLLLAPPVVVNALLCLLFGHTLLPGREPLITRFRRVEVGQVAPPFVSYTRHLTLLWTLLFAIATASSGAAAIWGDLTVWSWISLIAVPVANVAFFLGEHAYRWVRYGTEGRSSPLRTACVVFHPDVWRSSATRDAGAGHE
jgi:uncharacterized membrane protein